MKKIGLFFAMVIMIVLFALSASALEPTGQCGDSAYWTFDESTGELVISGSGKIDNAAFIGEDDIISVIIESGITSLDYKVFSGCESLSDVYLDKYLRNIGSHAFEDCSKLNKVYYNGTEKDFYRLIEASPRSYLYTVNGMYNPKIIFALSGETPDFEEKDKFAYGSYPQTKITDEVLIQVLNNLDAEIIGAFSEVEYLGEKYRAVSADETISWYKYEPIIWRVINPDTGMVLSDNILDKSSYTDTDEWLDNFYNLAFNEEQKTNIAIVARVRESFSDQPTYSYNGYDDETVFLATICELDLTYGYPFTGFGTKGTDYANLSNKNWWLRTEVSGSDRTYYMSNDTFVKSQPADKNSVFGLRPAMCLELENITCEHSYSAVITAPTCEDKGYTTYTCVCGDSYIADYTDETGHNYIDRVCTSCGKTDSIISGVCGTNLTWSLDTETGILTIDGEGEMDNYSLYNNINKTSAPWWDYYSQMTEIIIGDKVTSIGDYAFYKCKTATIIIPDNIEQIGDYAFYGFGKLSQLILSDNVEKIGISSFYRASIISLVIGDGLTEIPSNAFAYCPIEEIEWGKNIKKIGDYAFAYNYSYGSRYNERNIVIPSGVENIGSYAFVIGGSGSGPRSITIPLSVKFISYNIFGYYPSDTTSIYYEGTIEDWEKIEIASNYTGIRDSSIIFGHAHEYTSEITTEPTCLTTGIKTFTCDCGSTYTREISALGHDVIIEPAVSATCTETGLTKGEYCTRCDYKIEQEETSSLGHDEKVIPAVAATCYETGLTEGLGCSRCDVVFTEQEITPTTDHNIITYPAVAPTCTETGLTAGEGCSKCSHKVNQEIIPALGHTEVPDKAVVPTCTETGLTEGKHCNVCGEPTVAQEVIPALGHKEVFTTYVEPTCTEDGLSVGKVCETCKEVFIPAQVIPAKGHRLSNWIVTSEATCEANGKKIKICACGLVEEEIIEAIGHTDSDDNGKCDTCSASLREETEQPKQESNVFSFLTEFLNNILDFFRKLFGIK